MAHMEHMKVIAPVGLSGSGKSSAVSHLVAKGFPRIYGGGIIYKAMAEAGIEPTWDNQQNFREAIRQREGKDFVVKRALVEMRNLANAGQHYIVFDGLYTWSEYKLLKHELPGQLLVVAIVTPKHLRYQRLGKRLERPMQPSEVDKRDWSEIENLEKGGPIAIADQFIINDGSLEQLQQKVDTILADAHIH